MRLAIDAEMIRTIVSFVMPLAIVRSTRDSLASAWAPRP